MDSDNDERQEDYQVLTPNNEGRKSLISQVKTQI